MSNPLLREPMSPSSMGRLTGDHTQKNLVYTCKVSAGGGRGGCCVQLPQSPLEAGIVPDNEAVLEVKILALTETYTEG